MRNLSSFYNRCHIRTSHAMISHCTKFHLPTYSGSTWLTICHHWWIINEIPVNFKNGYHFDTPTLNADHYTSFHPHLTTRTLFMAQNIACRRILTRCHQSLIINEEDVILPLEHYNWHVKSLIRLCVIFYDDRMTPSYKI